MNDEITTGIPVMYETLKEATAEIQFNMASDLYTGSLLKTLAASKLSGRFLELGTGTGLATSWIALGMDKKSSLVTIDNDPLVINMAKKFIGDARIEFIVADAFQWLIDYQGEKFDLIFADAMAGKYELFEETINLLKPGGLYIIDDMLPQPNWPVGHDKRVIDFINELERRNDLNITKMNWSTGIILVAKK